MKLNRFDKVMAWTGAGVLALHLWGFTQYQLHRTGCGRKIHSAANLYNVGVGLLGYNNEVHSLPTPTELDTQGRPLHSWQTHFLPFIDQSDLFNSINLSLPWDDPANAPPLKQWIGVLTNPEASRDPLPSGLAPGHYAGNSRILGGPQTFSIASIKDGAATTFLAGEAFGNYRAWGNPGNVRDTNLGINRSPDGYGADWPDPGANFVFADGSVKFLRATIDPRVFRALGTPDAGDHVPDDY